eukprot:jgi/Botrbrau1/15590/Bobra.0246s0004.1
MARKAMRDNEGRLACPQALYSSREGAVRGFALDKPPSVEIALQAGEELVGASGFYGSLLQQLTFVTNFWAHVGTLRDQLPRQDGLLVQREDHLLQRILCNEVGGLAAVAFWTDRPTTQFPPPPPSPPSPPPVPPPPPPRPDPPLPRRPPPPPPKAAPPPPARSPSPPPPRASPPPRLPPPRPPSYYKSVTAYYKSVTLLPGTGLANLRVTGQIIFTGINWRMPDLAIFPRLVCPGSQMIGDGLSGLLSLNGLQGVMDGNPALINQTCMFSFTGSDTLVNVSALATFGRCGTANQRPDNASAPCLNRYCGSISTWSALCNYHPVT